MLSVSSHALLQALIGTYHYCEMNYFAFSFLNLIQYNSQKLAFYFYFKQKITANSIWVAQNLTKLLHVLNQHIKLYIFLQE